MFYWRSSVFNLWKHRIKSLLAILICAVTVFFMMIYAGNMAENKKQLEALSDAVPVSAHVSNLSGTQAVGLQITDIVLEGIQNSEHVKNFMYTVPLAISFGPREINDPKNLNEINGVGANDISAVSGIDPDSVAQADMVQDLLHNSNENVCIANMDFMSNHGLNIGDKILLSFYYYDYKEGIELLKYTYMEEVSVEIVDQYYPASYEGGAIVPDMIFPINWAKNIFAESNVDFQGDSARFVVKDSMKLNDFKESMKSLRLTTVQPQSKHSINGVALVVNDKTFVQSVESLERNINMMENMLPFAFAIVILISLVASYLLMQSRRYEFAVMRALGVSVNGCVGILILENVILEALGIAAGFAVSTIFVMNHGLATVWIPIGVMIAYTFGSFVAIWMLMRFSAMEILTKAE